MKSDALDPKSRLPLRLQTDMPTLAAEKTRGAPPPMRKPKAAPYRHAPWEQPEEEETSAERGDEAVLHSSETRGRRSSGFPDLNITATAQRLGVTKSHLAKVLAGINRPSIELALRIAAALGKDLNYVVGLYKSKEAQKREANAQAEN